MLQEIEQTVKAYQAMQVYHLDLQGQKSRNDEADESLRQEKTTVACSHPDLSSKVKFAFALPLQ